MSGDADRAARNAIRDDLDTTLIVEAAAGTGKTTALVERILRVLATGRATMIEIVAVTFTEKAAGELKLRLREALEQARAAATDAAERERLELALETLEEAHVNTIHGFCAELLRERPVEASVDPLFVVLTDPQANRLYTRAFGAWLQDALREPPEGVRRALRRTSAPVFGGTAADGPVERLRSAGCALAEWRHYPHPWQRPAFDREASIDRLVTDLHAFAQMTASPLSTRDTFYLDTDAARRLSQLIALEQSFRQRDLDAWESRLVDLARERNFSRARKGSGYKFSATVTRAQVLAARDGLLTDLQQFRREADADLAARLQGELADATARYEALKRAAGALDFADLLFKARDLIAGSEDLRRHLQTKFARLFVDEFQDTDPVQADILLALADDVPGKLFIVGDPKQAIYRFRGTDVGTYWRVKERIAEQGGRVVQLSTSYRSVPAIQRFVNEAFGAVMVADEASLQAGYIPLARDRDDIADQPAIVALPVPKPYASGMRPSAKAIETSLPDAVGAFIAWLVDAKNPWRVLERQADGSDLPVPIQPRHIAVLFRRFVSFGEDLTRAYVNAIEARGIPHLLVGGRAFHDRDEVEAIRAALAAVEWPDDELSVFATLRGPLFAIDDEHLFEFRDRFGTFHPFRIPRALGGNSGGELALTAEPTADLQPIADTLRLLQQLHRGRNYRPVADTIGRLLAETRAHVGFILRPAGEQALANVLHVAELARQYEASGGISFRGFLDELRQAAELADVAEAPIVEEGSDGVRLMTVHKAKGLEFPVVILADLTCRMSRGDASRYIDAGRQLCAMRISGWSPQELYDHEAVEVARDEAEGVRLVYVAATRARDLLVVPAIGDAPWEGGWISPLNRALFPPIAARRHAARGPGCPPFKSKDSVLARPGDDPASPATVCPGLHQFPAGYSVVWWDPSALALGAKPPFGVRREDLIVKDVPRDVVADGRSRYDSWRLAREDARAAGATPSLGVSTVREWVDAGIEPSGAEARQELRWLRTRADEVRIVRVGVAEHPSGAAFGLLVHGILAQAPFDAASAAIEELAAFEARALGVGEREGAAAAAAAAAIMKHDLWQRARRSAGRGACRRESAVSLVLDNGVLVEGIVDLAFEEDGVWTIVDYKTDRDLEAAGEERYRRQVAVYAAAIAQATAARTEGILVRL